MFRPTSQWCSSETSLATKLSEHIDLFQKTYVNNNKKEVSILYDIIDYVEDTKLNYCIVSFDIKNNTLVWYI